MHLRPDSVRPRAARWVIALVLAALAAGMALPARAGSPAAQHPPCAVQYIYGSQTCYAPADVTRAEARVPFALNPSPMVTRTLHLPLAQVIVWANGAGGLRIEYLYGPLPRYGNYGAMGARPLALSIREDRGRAGPPQPAYAQRACGLAMEISPATLPPSGHPYGPWYLVATMPHRDATLGIVANLRQPTLRALACAILRAS